MDAAVAETVAQATRDQAAEDARNDLKNLRSQAVEAGRERSLQVTKTSRIDPRNGEIRYNPAGRLMRDWYLHVYINQLRARLGEPAVTINAQQVEDTVSMLRRLRPAVDGRLALHAVATMRFTAIDDAARSAASIIERSERIGERRAIQHASDDRFDGDEFAIQVTRHWYLRCYQDQVERATETQMPLAAVTAAETSQVALVIQTGMPIHLIDTDGVPLINAHGTAMTQTDRQLAFGGTHLASPLADPVTHPSLFETLESRLTRAWNKLDGPAREHWLDRASVDRSNRGSVWSELSGEAQNQIIRFYLRADGPKQNDHPFVRTFVNEPPATAAMVMFGHTVALVNGEQRGADAPGAPVELSSQNYETRSAALSHGRGL